MVADYHYITDIVAFIDSTGGIGEYGRLNAEKLEKANRYNKLLKVVALIGMKTACHANNFFAAYLAVNQLACVRSDGRNKKIRNIIVFYFNRIFDF